MMRLLLVDNYDSFTFNLAHLFGMNGAAVDVVRNDRAELTADDLFARYDAVVIGPGPGRPENAGASEAIITRAVAQKRSLLGVCLGAQALGRISGGDVVHAPSLMHGKTAEIAHDGSGIFEGLPNPFTATRYHSLCVAERSVHAPLHVSARSDDGVVQGLAHADAPVYGVQFHPESVLTAQGPALARSFLRIAERYRS